MNTEQFNHIIDVQIKQCTDILKLKAVEYATEDRLHNFKVAAGLQQIPTKQALSGMMSKHTVSIYDMCGSPESFDMALWDEKITDSINYLLLLKAVVLEEKSTDACEEIKLPESNCMWCGLRNTGCPRQSYFMEFWDEDCPDFLSDKTVREPHIERPRDE